MTELADRAALVTNVEERLREVGRAVRRTMLDAMPDGEPVQWLYGPMREYPSRPGKALRPALCLSAGRAFGASSEDLLGISVATHVPVFLAGFLVVAFVLSRHRRRAMWGRPGPR